MKLKSKKDVISNCASRHQTHLFVSQRQIHSRPRSCVTAVYLPSSANGYLLCPASEMTLRMEHGAGSTHSVSFGCQDSVPWGDTKREQNR